MYLCESGAIPLRAEREDYGIAQKYEVRVRLSAPVREIVAVENAPGSQEWLDNQYLTC